MTCAVIDAAALEGRRDLHEKLAKQLELPAWYGKNLDALFDCLTEPGEPLVLRVEHPEALERALGGYAGPFLRVLEEAQMESGRFRFELAEEPETGLDTEEHEGPPAW